YLFVPLQNLKKALFKTTLLYDTGPFAKVIGSGLFIYRTILIIIGIFGSLLMIYRKIPEALIFILFFAILYLLLCFGTTTQARNIEIRYFLQADIMLLFPAAALISIVSDILKIIPSKIKLTGQIHPAAS
ncbi:MAG: hypothetical protein KJ607_05710, partial [Bacteroidetes bacterium]|nr:hypothetical protein [Bacteroidota bacterium]